MKTWSREEDQFIEANYLAMTDAELALALGRSFRSAQKRRQRLGLNKHPISKWAPEEDKAIQKAIEKGQSATSVGLELNRPQRQVSARARYLGFSFRKAKGRKETYRGYKVAGHEHGVRVFEHTQAMEQAIGRKLRGGESVHHIDCNKLNNAPENLHLCQSTSEHRAIYHSLNALAGRLFSRGLIRFDKKARGYSLDFGQEELFELLDRKKERESSLRARQVWEDASLSLSLCEWASREELFRVHWAATVMLLRAIGNVLLNVDAVRNEGLRDHVDNLWKRVKETTDDTSSFWEFIKPERDSVLKKYEFGYEQSESSTILIESTENGAMQFEIDPELYRPMIEGAFATDDSRDVLHDALQWWDGELMRLEEGCFSRKRS